MREADSKENSQSADLNLRMMVAVSRDCRDEE